MRSREANVRTEGFFFLFANHGKGADPLWGLKYVSGFIYKILVGIYLQVVVKTKRCCFNDDLQGEQAEKAISNCTLPERTRQ